MLTAQGYLVASCEGTEDEYVYIVFNQDMKSPATDVEIAVVGNWSYSNFAYVSSDTVEVVSPRIWRFTNSAYLVAAVTAPVYRFLSLSKTFPPHSFCSHGLKA